MGYSRKGSELYKTRLVHPRRRKLLNAWLDKWRLDAGIECYPRRIALWLSLEVEPDWLDQDERAGFLGYCKERDIKTVIGREEQRLLYWALHLCNPTETRIATTAVQLELL